MKQLTSNKMLSHGLALVTILLLSGCINRIPYVFSIYKEGLLTADRDKSIQYGAYIDEYELRFEPENFEPMEGIRLKGYYAVYDVHASNNFSGHKLDDKRWVHFEPVFAYNTSHDSILHINGAVADDREFWLHYGGGTLCALPDDTVGGGITRYRFVGGTERWFPLTFRCIPDYFWFIGHPTLKPGDRSNIKDTLFVMHVFRKGLKWPDVKNLILPEMDWTREGLEELWQELRETHDRALFDSLWRVRDSLTELGINWLDD